MHHRLFMLAALSPLLVLTQSTPVESRVYKWTSTRSEMRAGRLERQLLQGSTTDLEFLRIRAASIGARSSAPADLTNKDAESLVIVKEGKVQIVVNGESKIVGRGSVAIVLPGDTASVENTGEELATYYVITYRSKSPPSLERGKQAGGSYAVDWNDVDVKTSDLGGRGDIFNRPTAMFERLEIHVSRLNDGLTSHPAHTHRAEELIVMLQGDVRMLIGTAEQPATTGDVVFLGSQIPHSLTNAGSVPAEYFAIQGL